MAHPNAATNGVPARNIRIATNGAPANGPKVDPKDPQVRKLVYNMYRGMLDQKHQRANVILETAPQQQVSTDEGVGARVQSMMRQQNELKGGNMNTAGGPPPPPPPPPIPGVIPSSRLPSEIPARVPVMNPPAALAGAMLKDKKPFTYTPGGLDLSEINAHPEENGNLSDTGPPMQSRSFRVLQNVLDTHDTTEPQGPVHIPNLQQQPQQKPQQRPIQQPIPGPKQYQPPSQYQQQQTVGSNNTPSEQAVPEPKKYMGGSIPSRSFRMLQAMTSADDASGDGAPATVCEAPQPAEADTQHAASHNPTPAWKPASSSSSSSNQSPPTTSSLSPSSTNDISSDSGISSSSSKISPSYTTTKDSRVYRHVSPQISLIRPRQERVVNSALNSKEPSSPSSPSWKHNNQATKFFPEVVNSEANEADQEGPRLMKIVRHEPANPQSDHQEVYEKRYEGAHIPSRVFRQLQTEYSGSSDNTNEPRMFMKPKSPSPGHCGANIPSSVINSLTNEGNNADFNANTDPNARELDEQFCNGVVKTAGQKETVLKELTSQFDHMGVRKKPKAAPGRVFRYLQAQYDAQEDAAQQAQHCQASEEVVETPSSHFGYQGNKNPSPSFRFLQNHYQHEETPAATTNGVCEDGHTPDAPQYQEEPCPYRGARIPGRTFRSLQENGGAHPSVFGSRK